MAPPYYSGALDHPTSSLRGSPSPPANHFRARSIAEPAVGRTTITPVDLSHSRQLPSGPFQNETQISPSGRSIGRSKRRAPDNDDDQDEEADNDQEDDVGDEEDAEEEEEEEEEGEEDVEEEERERQQVESPSRRSFSQRDASNAPTNESSLHRSTDLDNHKRPRLLPSLSSSFTNNSLPPLSYPSMNGEYHPHSYPSAHSPNPNQHVPLRSSPSNVPGNSEYQRSQHQHQHRSHHASDQSDKPPVSPVVLGFQLTSADPNARDSILSALKLKEQQQALIQQRKGTPRNEKEYKKRGPGSNPTASSRARIKAKKAGETQSVESMTNVAEEDNVSSDMNQFASRNVSSSGLSPGTSTAAAVGGPDLPPIIRSLSTSNMLPPPSTFVAYSQSPPRPNPNPSSQLPPIDYHSHPHHQALQDKPDDSTAKRSDSREVRREESEHGSSGGSVGRTTIPSSDLAQHYLSEGGGSGGEPAGGKTFPTPMYPSHMTAPSHHHNYQHHQPQQPQHHYSTLPPPPPPPHHTHPPQPAHLPNGRASSIGSHQRTSISVQQDSESVSRAGPHSGFHLNSGGSGNQTAPSPYIQTSFSSSSSSSSSGRAPPPAPLSIHSSHHHPSSSHQHQQQQGSSHPSPVPFGYPTSGMTSTPSAGISTAPPKAMFLAPFERFYDALVDSRTLQSTMADLSTRSAEMNRRADETIHRVEDHHRRCISVLNTLQASSTSLQDMVRKEVYVIREEFSREIDSVWRRVHLLEAAFKEAGMDVPGEFSSGASIAANGSELDKERETEEARESSMKRAEFKHGRTPVARVDGSEVDELESGTEGTGDLENEDRDDGQAVEDENQENSDDGQDKTELEKEGPTEDEAVKMGGRDAADDDGGDEERTAQAPAFTIAPSKKPRSTLGMKAGNKTRKGP